MIHLAGVTMQMTIGSAQVRVLDDVTLSLPTDRRFALLGGVPTSRTGFLRLIAGGVQPESGEVLKPTPCSIIGNSGSYFHPALTGVENITLCARRYGIDAMALTKLVLSFDAIKADWQAVANKIPPKQRRAMETLVAALLPYDCYLLDEIERVPSELLDTLFEIFEARRAGLIFAAQSGTFALQYGDCAGVIQEGTVELFEGVDEALIFHG